MELEQPKGKRKQYAMLWNAIFIYTNYVTF